MNTRKEFTGIIFFLLLSFSCNKGTWPIYFENKITDNVNVDVLIPADTGLKYAISSIGLLQVNYTPTNQKILEKYEEEETNVTVENIYTAIQSNYDGFFSAAEEKTEIQVLELSESIIPNRTFDWERLKKITDSINFEALFFINNIKVTFDIATEIPLDGSTAGYHESRLKCNTTFYYTVLYPEKEEFETIVSSFSDKFEEDSYFFGSKPAYLHATKKIKEVLPYLCYENGKRAVSEFFSIWLSVNRQFYGRASKELRQAKKYVYSGNWDEAIKIWNDNKNSKNSVLAKHCQFNLILAEELTGSLEQAIILAEKYFLNYKESIALQYRRILERRLIHKKKIERQFNAPDKGIAILSPISNLRYYP